MKRQRWTARAAERLASRMIHQLVPGEVIAIEQALREAETCGRDIALLSVHKALALVEMSLDSEMGAEAVRKQTGGTAPELVQGILDGIVKLRAQAASAADERAKQIAQRIETSRPAGWDPDAEWAQAALLGWLAGAEIARSTIGA